MATLLHIESSPRGDYSVSRQIGSAVVKAWQAKNPDSKVIDRDLTKTHMSFVDLDWIMGAFTSPETHTEGHKKALAISDELIAEIVEADVIVMGLPMYNFAIPAVVKAWVDHVVRVGKTFHYTATGPEGHLGGRKVVAAVASAGTYAGTPMEAYDQEIPYLRQILGFIGITDVQFIRAGGTNDVSQGKISAEEYLKPYLEKARAAI